MNSYQLLLFAVETIDKTLQMTEKSYYRCTLCISSKIISVKEITDILGFEPTRAYEKGTLMSPRNPKSRIRQESSWYLDIELATEASFDDHIKQIISVIEKHLSQFGTLVKVCDLEIYCSFFAGEDNGQFFLNSSLLKRLTIIPIDITVALYPPTSNSEE
ncbi:DUF4279 domain-containing protein [Crocosphaera chwakensis]|uniref:DUF4279 domain-containing protein n=1 Tax=Crocosphaera chwakensis CCY0110 TaxID=391612 RepID=A3IZS6_9CHRO|nr:DUF4279 domain-containing protein [Crocosphaera chwakensis]EAZ88019.1 hypothetical protein CY0110_13141 [Crocosphaera chwakensis CCY0110]